MTDQPCPNCGANKMISGRFWVCGSLVMGVSGNFSESRQCLRNQLAAVTEEKLDLLAMLEGNGQSLASERHENTCLLGLLGEIKEWAIGWFGPLHDKDYRNADDDRSEGGEVLFSHLARINEGSK
jgi:hypothetical protein